MPRERLRLCFGLQCTDRLHPDGPRQRQKLYTAALKLLWFAVGIDSVQCDNAAQVALHAAIRPLLRLEDGHVLATLSAIVLALCEGRTGLAISNVFGAGKTRSAAVLLAGLLVFDPSLKLMVLTKENIAAHAVAEHLVSLQMPDYIQEKMGRLVGYYEQNRKGSYTPIGTSNRCYCLPQGFWPIETPSPSSMKKVLRMIDSKSKWAFEKETLCSYTIGEDLTST